MLSAAEVVAYRISAQQLDRPLADRRITDAAVLDLGLQDTGRDAASWALVNRGVPVSGPSALTAADELALVWSLRASPHFHRRSELPEVLVAISPFSDVDAAKRVVGAGQPLVEAGIPVREGLAEVARRMRGLVAEPMVKGELSSRLTEVLDPPYLRPCVPCGAVHCWEMTFRLGAFFGGLELEPDTSPPVLRRVPDWTRETLGPAPDPLAVLEHLQVIRSYLRLLGPAAPAEVAGFLDASTADIKAHWPADAVEVKVEGRRAWSLGELPGVDVREDLVRLLGPYDLLLQGKDRQLLVPDRDWSKQLWTALGRPGAVLSGTQIVGTWRPRAVGKKFVLRLDAWVRLGKAVRTRIEEQAVALAAHRGLEFAGVVEE